MGSGSAWRRLGSALGLLALFNPFVLAQGTDVEALLLQAEKLRQEQPERARALLTAAERDLAGNPRLVARAELLECQWSDSPAEVYKRAEAGLAAADRAGDRELRAEILICRGNAFENEDREADSERDFAEALQLARTLHQPRLEALALQGLGYARYYRGATADALDDLQSAYAIFSRLRMEKQRVDVLTIFGHIYADDQIGQYDRAIDYYRQALREYERTGQRYDAADVLFSIGVTHQKKGETNAALHELMRAAGIYESLKRADDVAYANREIGSVLTKAGRPNEALPWLEKALAHYRRGGVRGQIATTLQVRAAAYTKLGRWQEAVRDLESVRPHYQASKNLRFLDRVDEDLAVCYQRLGRWDQANAALQRRLATQRELFAAQRDETASRLRVEFDTARRDEENRALIRENALRVTALAAAQKAATLQKTVIVLVVVLALALAAFLWRQIAHGRRLRIMALTDELTRLPNRRHVMLAALERFALAKKNGSPLSVIAFDIDKFKLINDTWGHAAGDLVLQRVAHACRVSLRPGDVIGRSGGEEFLVILRDTAEQNATMLAERLRAAVEECSFPEIAPDVRVTISLGVASSERFTSFEKMAQRADECLYRAKESGRNRVVAASA